MGASRVGWSLYSCMVDPPPRFLSHVTAHFSPGTALPLALQLPTHAHSPVSNSTSPWRPLFFHKPMLLPMLVLSLITAATNEGTNPQQSKSTSPNDIETPGQDIHPDQRKGVEYYLRNYGPLAKVILTDFMDTLGFSRTYQLAIPVVGKLAVIVISTVMQFLPSLLPLQPVTHATFTFLRHFNAPQLKVINEVTDNIFEILNNEVVI